MGYYVGPAPPIWANEGLSLLQEHTTRAAQWAMREPWYDVTRLHYGAAVSLWGCSILIDPTLAPGTIELRASDGRVLGRIENIGTGFVPATGPTTRLVCRACGDTPPSGAHHCIACGARL